MQKDIFKQDITACFFNAGSYKLEISEVEAAEKEAKKDLKREQRRWNSINYRISSI